MLQIKPSRIMPTTVTLCALLRPNNVFCRCMSDNNLNNSLLILGRVSTFLSTAWFIQLWFKFFWLLLSLLLSAPEKNHLMEMFRKVSWVTYRLATIMALICAAKLKILRWQRTPLKMVLFLMSLVSYNFLLIYEHTHFYPNNSFRNFFRNYPLPR